MFKKATEIKKPIRALIYGEAGVGKTTLLGTLPPPVAIIDFEGGAGIRFSDREDILIAEVEDQKDLLEALKELPSLGVKSVAFDGFSVYLQARLEEIVKQFPGKSGGVEFKHWNKLFREAKYLILSLLRNPNVHLVFTALEKVEKNEEGNIKLIRPDIPKAVRRYLRGLVDLEGRLWEYEGRKLLSFKTNVGKMEVKDRTGKLSASEEPDFQKILSKIYEVKEKQEVRK